MFSLAVAALIGALCAIFNSRASTALVAAIVLSAGAHMALVALATLAVARAPYSALDQALILTAGEAPTVVTVAVALFACGLVVALRAWHDRQGVPVPREIERRVGPADRRAGTARAGQKDRRRAEVAAEIRAADTIQLRR